MSSKIRFVLAALTLFLCNLFVVIILKHDPKDTEICELARKSSTIEAWESYLEKFPKGWCVWEAQSAIERAKEEIRRIAEAEAKAREEQVLKEAEEKNTRAAWENYLREFPKGEHAFEAESKIEEMKKVGDLEWSDRSRDKMDWNGAKQYCEKLTEDDYNDWRLPNIDELRSLIQNCPKTEDAGECKISEEKSCLSSKKCKSKCPGSGDCEYKPDNVGYYSRFGDPGIGLWSSSSGSDATDSVWFVDFERGEVTFGSKSISLYVRCVRGTVEAAEPKTNLDKKAEAVADKGESSSEKKESKKSQPKKKRYKTIGGIEWSDRSSNAMNWDDAKKHCENLPKDDHINNWRLPDIDELRILVRNCPKTETGGECKVSEKNGCLLDNCFFSKESGSKEYSSNCSCDNKENNSGYYSKLGDSNIWLWSSSVRKGHNNDHWNVYFGSANVMTKKDKDSSYVRCVR